MKARPARTIAAGGSQAYRPTSRWLVAGGVAALMTAAALAGTSEELLQHHHADSILYGLAGTQQWTPYYWGQDRLGMLYALPASVIADPLWNLWAINVATTFAGVLSFVLTGWYFAGRRAALPIGLLGSGFWLILVPHYVAFDVFIAHPEYLGSLAPALAALLLAESRHGRRCRTHLARLAAAVLMAAAVWVNVTVVVFLAPAVIARGLLRRVPAGDATPDATSPVRRRPSAPRAGLIASIALLVWGLLVGWALPRLLADGPHIRHTSWGLVPLRDWPGAWVNLLLMDDGGATALALLALLVATGAGLFAGKRFGMLDQRTVRRAACAMAPQLVAACCWVLLVGTLEHVASPGFGEYATRYTTFAWVYTVTAVMTAAGICLLSPRWRHGRGETWAMVILLIAASIWRFGLPSQSRVIDAFDRRLGDRCRDVINHDCTHVAGHYWHTMDTVWYTNLLLHRRGKARRVYAITDRAGPTYAHWRDMPLEDARIAAVSYDWQEDMYGLTSGRYWPAIDPVPIERTEHIRVLKFRDAE